MLSHFSLRRSLSWGDNISPGVARKFELPEGGPQRWRMGQRRRLRVNMSFYQSDTAKFVYDGVLF